MKERIRDKIFVQQYTKTMTTNKYIFEMTCSENQMLKNNCVSLQKT